jgi:hypothetical protein
VGKTEFAGIRNDPRSASTSMKARPSKQPQSATPGVHLKDLAAKKDPKGGVVLIHETTHAQQGGTTTATGGRAGGGRKAGGEQME